MIPDFDEHGVVPPIRPGDDGASPERSPYPTDISTFCRRFGTSADRRAILRGLLDFRRDLRAAGFTDGYQWLNGSFVEDVERLRGRPPRDIDVVTFAALGDVSAQYALRDRSPELFELDHCKRVYKVDHYWLRADRRLDEPYARRVGYWYSMWSHQRGTNRWKGFVSVPLTSNDDDARAWLDSCIDAPEGVP